MQYAYIKNNTFPQFKKVLDKVGIRQNNLIYSPLELVIDFLNEVKPISGFIYNNYSVGGTACLEKPRMYFSDDNAQKIDAVRMQIEEWRVHSLLLEEEYFILLICLIESVSYYSNVSGVYTSFQKKWDPRALKRFLLRQIELVFNREDNEIFNVDSMKLIPEIETDILYLDPPYNERQYAPNYHILETIAKYDNPVIKVISGMRDYKDQKSLFCNQNTALKLLNDIAKDGKYKYLV